MALKKLKLIAFFIILSLTSPLLAYSENTETVAKNKNPYLIAANKKKKNPLKKSGPSLSGSWQSQDGSFTLVFLSASQLEFNGQTGTYTLVPGAIRLDDKGGKIDYKYTLNGNNLLINFPEGYTIQFQRVGSQSSEQYSNNAPAQINSQVRINKSKKGNNCNNIQVLPSQVSGGCNITLITPAQCEEIDLSNGKSYQFAWQTGGTFCETPYKLYVAGNPYNEQNVLSWQFSSSTGQISRTGGGYTNVTAQDLASLNSIDGTYSWVVMGWYGSHPASQNFRVKM